MMDPDAEVQLMQEEESVKKESTALEPLTSRDKVLISVLCSAMLVLNMSYGILIVFYPQAVSIVRTALSQFESIVVLSSCSESLTEDMIHKIQNNIFCIYIFYTIYEIDDIKLSLQVTVAFCRFLNKNIILMGYCI